MAETQMVVTIKLGEGGAATDGTALVDQFLSGIQARIVPFTREHVQTFFDAFRRYGKSRHPARLNTGDRFTQRNRKRSRDAFALRSAMISLTDLPSAWPRNYLLRFM